MRPLAVALELVTQSSGILPTMLPESFIFILQRQSAICLGITLVQINFIHAMKSSYILLLE